MEEKTFKGENSAKFTRDELKSALYKHFRYGQDLKVSYEGQQLVETKREGGCFVKMDFNGAPVLKTDFVEYMDRNDSGVIATFDQAKEAWESLREHEPRAHAVLDWALFHKSREKDENWIAARLDVTERTVYNLMNEGLRYLGTYFTAPRPVVLAPSAYLAS